MVKVAGLVSSGRKGFKKAKAAALFPFVFVRKSEYATPLIINHERIHFRQQLETLFVGSWLLQIFEDLYSSVVLGLKAEERYLYRAVEQEAYRHQHKPSYLKTRKTFSVFAYIKDKRKLSFVPDKAPEVIIGDKL